MKKIVIKVVFISIVLVVPNIFSSYEFFLRTGKSSPTEIKEADEKIVKKIDLNGVRNFTISGGTIIIEQCKECSEILTISADKNVMPYLKQNKQGENITLEIEHNISISGTNPNPIEYHIVVRDIEQIHLIGITTAQTKNTLDVDNLTVDINGISRLTASLNVKNLKAAIAGSSQATLSGKASQQTVNLLGFSKYNAEQLQSDTTQITSTGSSNAHIFAHKELIYDISGSSILDHYGAAQPRGSILGISRVRKH